MTATVDAAEAGFRAAIEADPADFTTRLVYADWLQDRDDPRADGWRATAACGLVPYHFESLRDWGMFKQGDRNSSGAPPRNLVPADWFDAVDDGWGIEKVGPAFLHSARGSQVFGGHTILAALVAAFGRLPAGRQAELLRGQK